MRLVERLRAATPDPRQLIAILSRSYEYIRRLPLKGLRETYPKGNSDLYEIIP